MNRSFRLSALMMPTLLLSLAAPAQAVVVDFEDVGFVPCTDAPVSSGGFTFSGSDFFHCVTPAGLPTPGANNGSSFLIEGAFFLTVSNDAGVPFTLRRVDLGTSYFNATSPNLMRVTGVTVNAGTVTQVVEVRDSFGTYALDGFDRLVSLTFSALLLPDPDGGPGYFALDNMVVEVPLPGSVPLVLLGLSALALARRARAGS